MSPVESIVELVEFLAEPAIRLWNVLRNKRLG